jgi:hypothetical protein
VGSTTSRSIHRLGVLASAATLLGIFLSGPLAVLVVDAIHPQPPWRGVAVFARNLHPVQLLPYLGGLVLVAGMVALVIAMHRSADASERRQTRLAVAAIVVFAAMICANYVVQALVVPTLAIGADDGSSSLVATLSMANPTSLAWTVEMLGWGLAGVATWLSAPVFGDSRLERATSSALVANGAVSVAAAAWTLARPGWVMSPEGLFAYALWNTLLALAAALALVSFWRRAAETRGETWRRDRARCPA